MNDAAEKLVRFPFHDDGGGKEPRYYNALHRARPFLVVPEYYVLHLKLDAAPGALAELFTGATIKHLTGQSLDRYAVALPPIPEQHRIVAKVDPLMALCDQLESQLTTARDLQSAFAAAAVHHLDI